MFGLRNDPATRLRSLMAELNINVIELAERSGVSRGTISSLRYSPDRRPNRDTMELIANALGVQVNKIWPGA